MENEFSSSQCRNHCGSRSHGEKSNLLDLSLSLSTVTCVMINTGHNSDRSLIPTVNQATVQVGMGEGQQESNIDLKAIDLSCEIHLSVLLYRRGCVFQVILQKFRLI